MASSEDHTTDLEGEDYEDQESQELFESFMDITKDAEILQDESNGDVVETKDENTVKEEIPNTIDKPDLASETENTKEEDSLTTTGEHNNEIHVNKEGDLNITKRFSKAVDELSDLEKQLSLMICSGAPGNPNDVANPTESGQTDKDVSATISETSQGVPCERVANWDDRDGSALNPSENQSDTASLEVPETSMNVTDIKDTNLEVAPNTDGTEKQNNDMNEEVPRNCQLNTNNAEILTVDKHEQKPTLLNQPAEDKMEKEATQEETTFVEVNEGSSLMSSNENDKPTLLNQYAKDKMEKEATQEETTFVEVNEGSSLMSTNENDSEKLQETIMNDTELEHEAVNNSSMNNTITNDPSTDDGQGKSDQEDGPSLANSETESSQQGLTTGEVDDNGTDSSAPEIEILMTDESGIAERKSLDSLDTDFDDLLPDSPALSDEGIDSDVKSLDDLDDDDATFDSGSMPDLPSINKGRFLGVEHNRMGSDSSTVSEREFKTSLNHKSDTELGKVNMKGHLLKLGGSGLTPRNWRKRWFVLKEDSCLYYYKHSKDKVPCGVIVLYNYSVTKAPDSSKKCCFKLNKGGARTYHLCAVSDDDMRDWMVALMKAASAVSASGTSFQILEGNVHNVSIPALSIKDPDCHGYLSKKGHNIKSWKRRYCVLKNGYLYYYSDMSNTTALGVAKLIGYQIKCGQARGKHFCFNGSPPDESMRIYHFSAETENDRERWMTRMEESIVRGTTSD